MGKQKISTAKKSQGWSMSGIFKAKTIRLATPVVATAGLLTSILPSDAVTDAYYNNSYRACAGQLLKADVTPEAAAQGCSTAIRPRDLSACVAAIRQRTQIAPADALASCSRARRPKELARCVVGVSQNTKEEVNPAVLTYCGRSLLPETFAQCVVGLRREISALTPIQALDSCIDAAETANGIATSPPILQLPIK
ncbi:MULTISPECIES: hypothetical protein [unclassified Nostoc]|uniref:hypothetical protein n=1 Tax=unclassified Nostoc TaxID=2593658 RepID=UPI001F559B9B|nr:MULTISPECIES: hypothetical protein [unclassified Nostoc]